MTYDAIIVGAGPGGATAATLMTEAGLHVVLLDKDRFPRDKVCGDAISGRSIDVMRELGVTEPLLQADSLDSWGITFAAPSGASVSIPITKDLGQPVPPAFVCTRQLFDQILFERALAAGADIRQETTVEDLLWENNCVVGVRLKNNPQAIRAPLVVGADGAYSAVARALGMPQLEEKYYAAAVRAYYENVTGFHEHNFMEIHFLDVCVPGYFWIFPMGHGRANVGVGMLSRDVKEGGVQLKVLLDQCVAHPRFGSRFRAARRVGSVKGWGLPLGSKPRPMAGDGWMLVGDAASLIDPFTAEGIGNAMASGRSAAQWAARARAADEYSAAFLAGFEREVRGYLRNELRLSHALQRLTGWRTLLDFVIGKASRVPDVAEYSSAARARAGDGWMLVGDAASLIDPFTAEGIGNAMASGRSAAQWAARARAADEYSAAFLAGFEREVRGYLRNELRLSHALQRLTGWRTLLDFVIGKASRVPDVAEVLSSMFDDRTQRRRLLSPLFYLRLMVG